MTDWIQQRNTAAQLRAGIDNLQPGYDVQIRDIKEMVADGRLPMEVLDKACERMLAYIVRTPHFRQYAYSDDPDLKAHAVICRRAGADGMVLLKNTGATLPLPDSLRVALFGLHSYDFMAGGTGSGNVVKPYVVNLAQGLRNAGYTVETGIDELYKSYKAYWDARNRCNRDPEERWYTAPPVQEPALDHAAVENLARTADVAIITLGRQAGEGGDRSIEGGFNLTDAEQRLTADVCDSFHALGKRVVVVLNTGGSVAGKESVQLYVTAPESKLTKPAIELKSFAKTRLLQPGESQTLRMTVSPYDLASFDPETQSWITDKGRYEVRFAASATDIRANVPFTVSATRTWPVHDVLRRPQQSPLRIHQ